MATATNVSSQQQASRSQLLDRYYLRTQFNKHALTILAIGIFIFLYVPIIILIIYSFNENRVVGVWSGFSTQWYSALWNDNIGKK